MIEELGTIAQQALGTFGIHIDRVRLLKESHHLATAPFCVIVGIVVRTGERKGIFSFEFEEPFARTALNALMQGYEVELFSEMGISALLELSNILSGNLLSAVAPQAMTTPPTAVYGQNVKALLNTLPSYKTVLSSNTGSLIIGLSIT